MTDNFHTRPVIGVGVMVWRDKQILLGERLVKKQASCWQFPGGHLENDESVIECARREVLEETGIKIKNLRHLGFTNRQFEVAQNNYITLLVSAEYDSGEVEMLEPDKCARWQWFDYQKLPTPLFEPISIFLSQLATSSVSVTASGDLYSLHCAAHVLPDAASDVHR